MDKDACIAQLKNLSMRQNEVIKKQRAIIDQYKQLSDRALAKCDELLEVIKSMSIESR